MEAAATLDGNIGSHKASARTVVSEELFLVAARTAHVGIEFHGFTAGLLAPSVNVFPGDVALPLPLLERTIVATASAVPREMRWGTPGCYLGERRWWELKHVLNDEVFMPQRASGRWPASLYGDWQGHAHVRYTPYDFVLTAGVAMFYRVCEELLAGRRLSSPLERALISAARSVGFDALFDPQFDARCEALIRRHAWPCSEPEEIARRARNLMHRALDLAVACPTQTSERS